MSRPGPIVGVGVIVVRDGLVLLGERVGSHGAGTWAPPGGHMEFGETVAACAARELLEETGLALRDVEAAPYTSDLFAAEGKHYVTLFVVAGCGEGEPQRVEPDKCMRWQWCRWSDLPAPLFRPLQTLVESGFVPRSAA
jgi:8-oxo-dGTP diphosphatase